MSTGVAKFSCEFDLVILSRVCLMAAMQCPILMCLTVLFLSSSIAVAQDYTTSTTPASITAYKQLESNFASATVPPFPCNDISSPYTSLDLTSTINKQLLSVLIGDVFEYYLYSTYPLTSCSISNVPSAPIVQVAAACKSSKVNIVALLLARILRFCRASGEARCQ